MLSKDDALVDVFLSVLRLILERRLDSFKPLESGSLWLFCFVLSFEMLFLADPEFEVDSEEIKEAGLEGEKEFLAFWKLSYETKAEIISKYTFA